MHLFSLGIIFLKEHITNSGLILLLKLLINRSILLVKIPLIKGGIRINPFVHVNKFVVSQHFIYFIYKFYIFAYRLCLVTFVMHSIF